MPRLQNITDKKAGQRLISFGLRSFSLYNDFKGENEYEKKKAELPGDFYKIMERGDCEEIKAVFQDQEMVKELIEDGVHWSWFSRDGSTNMPFKR